MAISKKSKTAYFCTNCGAEHPKWQGQCRECNEWNSLVEEKVITTKSKSPLLRQTEKLKLPDISSESMSGYKSGIDEFDRVMGGHLLPGMTVLLGGEPGIGKSTLLLQAADAYSQQGLSVLYVSGEESLSQLKVRSRRLDIVGENITVANCTSLEEIHNIISSDSYQIILIDSIQTISSDQLDSPPGTVAQIREASHQLILNCKTSGTALFLIGHVTKDGIVAGPKLLEHMVDTVIYFEGDQTHLYRMLRASKNRFGSIAEIGLFEMSSKGLVEVSNPSSIFLSEHYQQKRTGSVVTALCEGTRPMLVEIQALVTPANYGTPQRVAGGIDNKRLALLLAILEKRGSYPMGSNDVFVSVAGGLRILEPAIDLSLITAIVSSLLNKPVDPQITVIGEVGLSGEVRGVSMAERRINEASKLGFKKIVLPQANISDNKNDIELIGVDNLQTALDILIG
jgi:DNA repair protein RadA/Sms